MRIAEKGLPADVIAALGAKAVATSTLFLGTIDYWSDVPEEAQRLWSLYILFGCHPDHVTWLFRHGYLSPDEWLGPEGTDHRSIIARTGLRQPEPSDGHKSRWADFENQHKEAEIDAAIAPKWPQGNSTSGINRCPDRSGTADANTQPLRISQRVLAVPTGTVG